MEWIRAATRWCVWGQMGNRMQRQAVTAILGLAMMAAAAHAAGPTSGTVLVMPDDTEAPPHDRSKLILPGQPDSPGLPAPTLPPLWLVPLPDHATRVAERAQLDAALEARFGHATPPAQSFDDDIVPLAAGLPWQAMQRRVDGTLGDKKLGLLP